MSAAGPPEFSRLDRFDAVDETEDADRFFSAITHFIAAARKPRA